jgi:hypothetical protein
VLLKAVLSLPEPGGRPIDHRRDLRVVAHVASEGDRFAAVGAIRRCATFISKRNLLFLHRGKVLTESWLRRHR